MLAKAGECVCGDIVSRLPLAQATVSQHLKVLKQCGADPGRIDPPRVCYLHRFRPNHAWVLLSAAALRSATRLGSPLCDQVTHAGDRSRPDQPRLLQDLKCCDTVPGERQPAHDVAAYANFAA